MKLARILPLIALCSVVTVVTSGCIKPGRSMPDASVIGYDGKNAIPPDCDQLRRSSLLTDGGIRRPGMEWGCATYTNLAAQIAHARDLVAPARLGPADAGVAASAVRRYENGQTEQLDKKTSRNSD